MKKIDGNSLDLDMDNISKLTDFFDEHKEDFFQIFPEIESEGKIDFEKLRLILGDEVEESEERYNFTWHGKRDAIRLAQTPTTGTLRPDKDNSKNWDETENIYIEGDNLEVLKILQKSYHGKIKMIYIDPPYNTGKDFVYRDNYRDNMKNYLEFTDQVDEDGKKLSTNTETSGRYHTDWLNMMYPRLRLARNLLTDDGVIFISIDDNEVHNLRKICDEIFGEENFRNSLIVRRRVKSLNTQFAKEGLKSLNVGSEYILVYSKSSKFIMNDIYQEKKSVSMTGRWNVFWSNADRPTMRYELLGFKPDTGQWRWSEEKALKASQNYKKYLKNFHNRYSLEEYWEKTGRKLRFIRRIDNGKGKNGGVQYWIAPNKYMLRSSNWMDLEVSEIKKEIDLYFTNPKNSRLIYELIRLIRDDKDSIILDFFSGSATTAHAVMELNAEDGGNRKYIMVQLPEPTDEKSEAFKAGYKTIADIGRERIRRAGEKVLEDNKDKEGIEDLDIGFKAFSLDSSNIKEWNPDFMDKELDILDLVDNFVEGREEKDILYEIILKYGIDLSTPIEEHRVDNKTIYSVGFGSVYVALDKDIDDKLVQKILELKKEDNMPNPIVVFRDNGFKDDQVKLNAKLTLQDNGIEEVVSI